jgi:preprotein translocase subunit SecA
VSKLQFATLAAAGAYPERRDAPPGRLEQLVDPIQGWLLRRFSWLRNRDRKQFLREVHARVAELGNPDRSAIIEEASRVRYRLRSGVPDLALIAQAFALIREVSGLRLGMRHYDAQMIGGWTIINGMIAEMQTGEGKTLTATLPAATVALAGLPVHVVTVNDYLAERDAKLMRPVYEALGLSVGVIQEGMTDDERRGAYACDVTYCTNKQLAFDYLRDRIALGRRPGQLRVRLERLYRRDPPAGRLLLRGLCYVIVDEADSVLIDEARTPLIISGKGDRAEPCETYALALSLSAELEQGRHFKLNERERHLQLTDHGRSRFRALAAQSGAPWKSPRRGDELAYQALVARYLFHRDQHYLVNDDKVQIIDEYTGRTMADRSWEHGLHQMIEAKEGCPLSSERRTLARISYQRFFRRYLHLSGMTGTASEAAAELWTVYRMPVMPVPTHRPVRRRALRTSILPTVDAKWRRVIERVAELHAQGRPVLVGTRSVEASEAISQRLRAQGLTHAVLNARQNDDEAEVIARAGQPSRITVATNMAGRGTDIKLGSGVAEAGGLHVILTERHEAGRIDRQLQGRCARQGDPGSYEAILSIEDELVAKWLGTGTVGRRLASVLAGFGGYAEPAFRAAQRSMERRHGKVRRDLLRVDTDIDRTLSFSGTPE